MVERSEEKRKQLTPNSQLVQGWLVMRESLLDTKQCDRLERMTAKSARKTFAEKVNSLMMGCMCPQEVGTTTDPK